MVFAPLFLISARVYKTKDDLSTKPVPSKFSPSKKRTKNMRYVDGSRVCIFSPIAVFGSNMTRTEFYFTVFSSGVFSTLDDAVIKTFGRFFVSRGR